MIGIATLVPATRSIGIAGKLIGMVVPCSPWLSASMNEPVFMLPVLKEPVLRSPALAKPVLMLPPLKLPVLRSPGFASPVLKLPALKLPVL